MVCTSPQSPLMETINAFFTMERFHRTGASRLPLKKVAAQLGVDYFNVYRLIHPGKLRACHRELSASNLRVSQP